MHNEYLNRKNYKERKFIFIVVFGMIVTVLSGCDNTMDPVDLDRGTYSIYGAIDLNKNKNYVRVKDINALLNGEATKNLPVTVIFENMESGSTQVMDEKVVEFEEVYTHNFRTTMPIDPATKYRVRVEGNNGRTVSTSATTPVIATASAHPVGETCRTSVTITFSDITDSSSLEVLLGFEYNTRMAWGKPESVPSRFPDVRHFQFNPLEFINRVMDPGNLLPQFWCHELSSDIFQVKYLHYGPDFNKNTNSSSTKNTIDTRNLGGYYEDIYSFQIDTLNICVPNC